MTWCVCGGLFLGFGLRGDRHGGGLLPFLLGDFPRHHTPHPTPAAASDLSASLPLLFAACGHASWAGGRVWEAAFTPGLPRSRRWEILFVCLFDDILGFWTRFLFWTSTYPTSILCMCPAPFSPAQHVCQPPFLSPLTLPCFFFIYSQCACLPAMPSLPYSFCLPAPCTSLLSLSVSLALRILGTWTAHFKMSLGDRTGRFGQTFLHGGGSGDRRDRPLVIYCGILLTNTDCCYYYSFFLCNPSAALLFMPVKRMAAMPCLRKAAANDFPACRLPSPKHACTHWRTWTQPSQFHCCLEHAFCCLLPWANSDSFPIKTSIQHACCVDLTWRMTQAWQQ